MLFFCALIKVFGFMGTLFFMLSWMFQHACLDNYCFECLICIFFFFFLYFLYVHLFSAIVHVSHGKAL